MSGRVVSSGAQEHSRRWHPDQRVARVELAERELVPHVPPADLPFERDDQALIGEVPEFRRRDHEVWQLRVDTLGAEAAAKRSPEDGKRSPVEVY